MSELTAHTVADHGASHRAAHDEAHPGGLIVARLAEQVCGDQLLSRAMAAAHRPSEVRTPPHPRCRGEHRAVTSAPACPRRRHGRSGQTLTRARPLRRRAERIARPARVRMRSRNPCVFARWRLFGWNVRLLTGTLQYTGHGQRGQSARTPQCAGAPRRFQDMVNRARRCPGQQTRYAAQAPPVKPLAGRPRSPRRRLAVTPLPPARHPRSLWMTARDPGGTLRNTCRLPNEYRS
jgi:hypothetical protein